MANNKGKVDQLHDLLPKHLNSKTNTNWKAIVEALGEADQGTADLVAEVRKQFFIKTASRPYLDRLAANSKISRPRLVGMDDPSFRQYIPVLSYQPKQVKLIIDQLLDVFFFKESTTAFLTSQNFESFDLSDGWELEMIIDEQNSERIVFKTDDFTNINAASADEVVAAINRQSKYSYATPYYDSITKNTYIKIFTNTVGSKGSLRVLGGRANIALRLNGFIDLAGNGANTQWGVTKVGDQVTFQYASGADPGVNVLQEGDLIIIDLAGNEGSFSISNVDLVNNSLTFTNLFGTGTAKATATLGANTFTAEKGGTIGNSISLVFNGLALISTVVSAWNIANPNNKVLTTGADTIPSAQVVNLTGGINIIQTSADQVKFLTPNKYVAYLNARRAMTWETSLGEITVEMPTSPPVVKRSLKGSDHVNGAFSQMSNRDSNTSLTVVDAFQFPESGTFYIERVDERLTRMLTISENVVVSTKTNTRLNAKIDRYEYASRVALTTTGDIVDGVAQIINLASVVGLAIGQQVTMTGVPAYARIVSIAGPVVNLSHPATATATTQSVKFLGNQLTGITPDIPALASLNEFTLSSLSRTANVVSGVTVSPHGYVVGESIIISGTSGGPGFFNGSYTITSASGSNFTYNQVGGNGAATILGNSRVERIGLANSTSKIFAVDAVVSDVSRTLGSYIWDQAAAFVLSSNTAEVNDAIQAGKIIRLLNTTANDISPDGGFIIFDYGRDNQEGPVRYLYKPTNNTIAIDPSYTFKHSHPAGSPIVAINRKGPHQMSGRASEYPAYITDPSEARFILQELIKSVKSAGIFVNFLVRYPEQLYATLDVYQSGVDPDDIA
jgi:hypothetical protein